MKHILMFLLASAPLACMAHGANGQHPAFSPTHPAESISMSLVADDSDDDKVYECNVVEKQPQYPGGNTALLGHISKTMRYPKKALDQNLQGVAMTAFIIEKNGRVGDVRVINDAHPLFKEEAIRVVKSFKKFKPGTVNGKPVRIIFYLPVRFNLQ